MKRIAGIALLTAAAALCQPAVLTQAEGAEGYTVAEMPAPVWGSLAGGKSSAELRLRVDGAAAMRIQFATLNLPEGSEVYLYGKDAAGRVLAIHGPYTGHGPLNVPEFDSQILEGSEAVIAVRGEEMRAWPFALHGVEAFTAASLEGMEMKKGYRPPEAKKRPIDVRSAYIDGVLTGYEVVDGIAIREGDMVLGPADEIQMNQVSKKGGPRGSAMITGGYWNGGVIPYTIQNTTTNFPVGGSLDTKVRNAIAYWNSRFPGVLVPRTNQTDYVAFRFVSGVCQSQIGRKGNVQYIDLDDNCSRGNAIHEIGHALGFVHEQNRYDRTKYVRINWSNVMSDKLGNFAGLAEGEGTDLGDYDYGSVMHYPPTAFAIDPNIQTIIALQTIPDGVTMGQRAGLSAGDEAGMRTRYCSGSTWTAPSVVEVDSAGDTGEFTVSMPPYCTWTITENVSWLMVTSPKSGTGSVTVKFQAAGTASAFPRTATIRVGPRAVTIRQIP